MLIVDVVPLNLFDAPHSHLYMCLRLYNPVSLSLMNCPDSLLLILSALECMRLLTQGGVLSLSKDLPDGKDVLLEKHPSASPISHFTLHIYVCSLCSDTIDGFFICSFVL